MENEEKNKKDEKKPNADEKKKPVGVKKESDFKRKYFEYYDDIKISDRQDW